MAQLTYLVALAAVLLYGLVRLTMNPGLIRSFVRDDAWWLWPVVFTLGFLFAAFALVAKLMGQMSSPEMLMAMAGTMIFSFFVALAVYPAAREGDPERIDARRETLLRTLPLLLVLAYAWSISSMGAALLIIRRDFEYSEALTKLQNSTSLEFMAIGCMALLAAVFEEIIFRGGLQAMLERTPLKRYGAIIVVSLIFAMGHTGFMKPNGIKEIQIFGIALIFAYARLRHGLTAAIGLHLVHNLTALILDVVLPEDLNKW